MATAGLIMGYASVAIGLCACLAFAGMMTLGFAIPFINH